MCGGNKFIPGAMDIDGVIMELVGRDGIGIK
jgi:hypothetical protein